MENKQNLLVTLADENYIQQAKQLFSSVYWNAGWDGDYMLLAHNIPEDKLLWFREKGILIKKCDLILEEGWGEKKELPPVIADKFYLFTEEFKKWGHIAYLDSDIIVRSSLAKLSKVKYFSAVQNYYFSKLCRQIYNQKEFAYKNRIYNINAPAFNAGVIAFNTDLITPDTYNELITILKDNNDAFIYGEQTAMNIYFYKKWMKLPAVYNVFINFHNYRLPSKLKYIIIHFIARRGYPHIWEPENACYKEWKANLDRAELMDLNKIQKVKKWSTFKIKYYSLLLNLYIIPDKLTSYSEYFIRFKAYIISIISFPDRIIGRIGKLIKKSNPDLYHKLKRAKGGK